MVKKLRRGFRGVKPDGERARRAGSRAKEGGEKGRRKGVRTVFLIPPLHPEMGPDTFSARDVTGMFVPAPATMSNFFAGLAKEHPGYHEWDDGDPRILDI